MQPPDQWWQAKNCNIFCSKEFKVPDSGFRLEFAAAALNPES